MDENGEIDTSYMNSDERAGWNELMEVIKLENQSPISPEGMMNNNQILPPMPAKPFLRIVEQPAAKALRFRYECEGRSAGSIPGVNSTSENKTFPTIEIVNYDKDAVVVVSCVTKDPPYRPHPHKVVGRDGCGQKYDKGICEVKLKGSQPLRAVFNNLGIQCVKRREVATSLRLRREHKINPFSVPYPSNDQKSTYDLNVVRLCFQGFINPTGQRWEPLQPQISNPIFDKKGVFELKICQLCSCAGKANGGDRIILLCEKVDKNDIKIKFSECNNEGEIKWAAYADFQQQDIHKQTAIVFRTPRYENTDITEAVKVYIQLERPSDGGLSEPLEFEYHPDPDHFKRKRLRSDKSANDFSALKKNMQGDGLLMDDMSGQYQTPSFTAIVNNLEKTANDFTLPQFKDEPAPSPDYYVPQLSPGGMIHSPVQHPSSISPGMQYTTLQPSAHANTNPYFTQTTTANFISSPWNQLPTMSGGSLTSIANNQSTNQTTQNSNIFPSNIPMQSNNNNINNINGGSIEMNSEERIIVNQFLAGGFETFRNIFCNSITDNATGTEIPLLPEPEEELTASGLLNELDGEQLMEIANLSVSGET